jgi:nicotinate-nucleotide--dimethylbenzimidazole phosphoribosyltransferase
VQLDDLIASIPPLDERAMAAARARQDQLTKPRGSLGRLESLSIQLAGITANALPDVRQKVVVTMAVDHGVVAEGVSAYPQEVTPQMVANFLRGGAAINVLAQHVGARVVIVDMGVAAEMPPHSALVNQKVAPGTGNIAAGPAMTREQAIEALTNGAQVVKDELAQGLDILAVGEMGIGNTTPAAAIGVALSGRSAEEIVGRGTGVDDAGLARKTESVQRAIQVNRPNPNDALDVLSKLGGFEIGGMAGAMLCAAANRRAVMVDGFISTAAAMIAASLAPRVRDYLIASHRSEEQGHHILLGWLGLEPLLDLDLRLGEGTGAALGLSLAEAACRLLREMATFGEAGVSDKADAECVDGH